jgi:hypothetical protein
MRLTRLFPNREQVVGVLQVKAKWLFTPSMLDRKKFHHRCWDFVISL